jgi:ATP-dependent protease Clp ATPase subunit
MMKTDPTKNIDALLKQAGVKPEAIETLRKAPAKIDLPGFTHESIFVCQNLKDYNVPVPADSHWPIAMMQFLMQDASVQKYLDEQNANYKDLFLGMRKNLVPKLQEQVANRSETIKRAKYDAILTEVRQYALSEGSKKVTPVIMWRWLMTQDPTRNMDTILKLALPGAKKETVDHFRNAPPPAVKKASSTSATPTKADIEGLNKALNEVPKIVLGQEKPLQVLLKDIKTATLGYNIEKNPHKPKSVALLLGPSGVGKTYSCEEIAKVMGRPVIYVPMNEFRDAQNKARLTGAAPGYVGFGDSESFADKMVKANDATAKHGTPAPIIIFDEIEKADKEIYDVIMQIFDKGQIQTGKGQTASFEGTYIFMTSNIAQRQIAKAKAEGKSEEEIQAIVKSAMEGNLTPEEQAQNPDFTGFRPEFIGRINSFAIFETLSKEDTGKILDQHIARIRKNAKESDGYELEVTPALRGHILDKGYSIKTGAREVKNLMEKILHNPLVELREQLILGDKLAPGARMVADVETSEDGRTKRTKLTFIPPAPGSAAAVAPPPPPPAPPEPPAKPEEDAPIF